MTLLAPAERRWQFWIDRGGTFTDVVARRPDGSLATAKLLSENPEQYADAAVEGIRRLLGLRAGEPVTPAQVECVNMGTTVATNALLERKGEPTLLVTTRGFGDALRIGTQARPRLFDRHIVLPEGLYARVVEADERLAVDGSVVQPLDEAALASALREAVADGLRACAIVFMHGWRHSAHEAAAARLARQAGFAQVSVSHEVSPLLKLVPRGADGRGGGLHGLATDLVANAAVVLGEEEGCLRLEDLGRALVLVVRLHARRLAFSHGSNLLLLTLGLGLARVGLLAGGRAARRSELLPGLRRRANTAPVLVRCDLHANTTAFGLSARRAVAWFWWWIGLSWTSPRITTPAGGSATMSADEIWRAATGVPSVTRRPRPTAATVSVKQRLDLGRTGLETAAHLGIGCGFQLAHALSSAAIPIPSRHMSLPSAVETLFALAAS